MSSRGPFGFDQLLLPAPTSVAAAQAALASLAALPGQPRLVLEARGQAGKVTWYLGADAATRHRAAKVIRHHLRGVRVESTQAALLIDTSVRPMTAAGAVRAPGHRGAPLAAGRVEEVARSLLGALSQARRDELVRLQVLVGPRHRPQTARDVPSVQRARVRAKVGEHRLSCEVRVGAAADDRARAGSLVHGVAASLRPLEAPSVALRLKRASLRSLDEVRTPLCWPLVLGISELVAVLGWPIGPADAELAGVPPAHPRLLPVPSAVPHAGRVLGVSALDPARPVAQGVEEATRVTHILGPIGTGKSTMLVNLALADAAAGRSVVLVDGKGDAVTDFLERLDPARHDDLVCFDPTDGRPVGVPVFASNGAARRAAKPDGPTASGASADADRDADVIFGVIRSLYGDQLGPRSSDLAHAAILTLARAGGCSLSMLPLVLGNAAVRRPIVAKVAASDPLGIGGFWAHFEALSDAERAHVTAPLRNKLDPILSLRPSLRAMFGQPNPTFSFDDLFLHPTKRPIVLISLGSGDLGPEGARLLGSILLALLWQAAQKRTRLPHNRRHPVMLYLDEFQEIVRLGDLGDALGRARGLGVAFAGLAHQSLTQLTPAMRQAVMAHARSRVCFQLSPQDARDIAATTNGALDPRDLQELPAFTAQASLLSGGDRMPWCTLRTRPLSPPRQPAEVVRARSRKRYGRDLADVEAELLAVAGWTPADHRSAGTAADYSSRDNPPAARPAPGSGETFGRTPRPRRGSSDNDSDGDGRGGTS